jgi:hypothetical protein
MVKLATTLHDYRHQPNPPTCDMKPRLYTGEVHGDKLFVS